MPAPCRSHGWCSSGPHPPAQRPPQHAAVGGARSAQPCKHPAGGSARPKMPCTGQPLQVCSCCRHARAAGGCGEPQGEPIHGAPAGALPAACGPARCLAPPPPPPHPPPRPRPTLTSSSFQISRFLPSTSVFLPSLVGMPSGPWPMYSYFSVFSGQKLTPRSVCFVPSLNTCWQAGQGAATGDPPAHLVGAAAATCCGVMTAAKGRKGARPAVYG